METPKRSKGAFALIELMVVVAIISLLSAILYPVFANAKASAKKTVCVSNIRQIGFAWIMYANDYDDTMPLYGYYDSATGPAGSHYAFVGPLYAQWFTSFNPLIGGSDLTKGLLYPYVEAPPLVDCPAAVGIPDPSGTVPLSYGINGDILQGCDYITRGFLGSGGTCPEDTPLPPVNFTGVSIPAETILLTDSAAAVMNSSNVVTGIQKSDGSTAFGSDWLERAHGIHPGGTANVVWLDGHSKSEVVNTAITQAAEAAGTYGSGNKLMSANFMGDIIPPGATIPAGPAVDWLDTPAAASAGYYYLLSK